MNWANFKQRVLEVKSFFISYAIATVLYAIFGIVWIFFPDIVIVIDEFLMKLGLPARIDFFLYLICVIPVAIAGFAHGYRKLQDSQKGTRRSRIDSGFYYLQLYTLVGLIYGPCIWDNIIIFFRNLSPEQLGYQMEIQFVFVFFLTISLYRFFTIIYVIVGTYFILYVRKRSQILWVYLFFIYIYSSLVIGSFFGLSLYPESFVSEEILVYVIGALVIYEIIAILYSFIKPYKEKVFN